MSAERQRDVQVDVVLDENTAQVTVIERRDVAYFSAEELLHRDIALGVVLRVVDRVALVAVRRGLAGEISEYYGSRSGRGRKSRASIILSVGVIVAMMEERFIYSRLVRPPMGATEMEQWAMEVSGKALWELGGYSLQVNREGYLQVTLPVLAARNMDPSAGDEVTAYLDRRSGALLFAPVDVELGNDERNA